MTRSSRCLETAMAGLALAVFAVVGSATTVPASPSNSLLFSGC